ncbi:MAG: hypothetical protein AAFV45_08905 [Pseudomonadota bacterium]
MPIEYVVLLVLGAYLLGVYMLSKRPRHAMIEIIVASIAFGLLLLPKAFGFPQFSPISWPFEWPEPIAKQLGIGSFLGLVIVAVPLILVFKLCVDLVTRAVYRKTGPGSDAPWDR